MLKKPRKTKEFRAWLHERLSTLFPTFHKGITHLADIVDKLHLLDFDPALDIIASRALWCHSVDCSSGLQSPVKKRTTKPRRTLPGLLGAVPRQRGHSPCCPGCTCIPQHRPRSHQASVVTADGSHRRPLAPPCPKHPHHTPSFLNIPP